AFTDADGFLTAPSGELQRDSYALVGEVVLEGDWIWWWKEPTAAQVRMTSEQPVFIGIAARPDVEAYLSDVSYSQIDDIDFDEYRRDRVWKTDFRDSVGPDAPALPGEQAFWRASIEGEGSQTLRWELEPGDWMLVVMNVDGSRGVAAEGTVGVQAPWLLGVGIGLLAVGVVLVAIGLVLILLVARRSRTVAPQEPTEPQQVVSGAYPLTFKAEMDKSLSPALWLVKWFLLIPHFIVMPFLWVGFAASWLLSLFAILFTGRYPRGLFDYNVGVMRWSWRVAYYGYEALGTDRYPPFTLKAGGYPADLDVVYPERLSRGLALVKWWLLAIPHYIVTGIFQGGAGFEKCGLIFILTIFAAVTLLFTGRYPKDIFRLVVGMNRWTLRLWAYVALMTDEYPPFRLEE
ncbi:DUF4389 domain-containing protein, partial [Candidatus Bipolaricaulota bacterium]